MPIHKNDILGVILAGGQSRRMNHHPKWALLLDEKPLLEHIIKRLQTQVATIAINGKESADVNPSLHNASGSSHHLFNHHALSQFSYPLVDDCIPDQQGPLVGLLSGLRYAQQQGFQWVASCPCDSPFIPVDYIKQLSNALSHQNIKDGCAVIKHQNRLQGVFGLWSTALIHPLQTLLEDTDHRALKTWIQQRQEASLNTCITVDVANDNDYAFFNINTPDELAMARQYKQQLT